MMIAVRPPSARPRTLPMVLPCRSWSQRPTAFVATKGAAASIAAGWAAGSAMAPLLTDNSSAAPTVSEMARMVCHS